MEQATHCLLTGKVVQTTSVQKFINNVRDTCQKAGWDNKGQWMALVQEGLKDEVTTAMAGHFPDIWDNFVLQVEQANEDLQQQKERNKTVIKKGTTSMNKTTGEKTNNSKYKLTDKE